MLWRHTAAFSTLTFGTDKPISIVLNWIIYYHSVHTQLTNISAEGNDLFSVTSLKGVGMSSEQNLESEQGDLQVIGGLSVDLGTIAPDTGLTQNCSINQEYVGPCHSKYLHPC